MKKLLSLLLISIALKFLQVSKSLDYDVFIAFKEILSSQLAQEKKL